MITAIVIVLSPFVLNALTAVVNAIVGIESTTAKRVVLSVLSLVGMIAVSASTGAPIDPANLNADLVLLAEAFYGFISAHGSYHLFFKSKTA